MQIMRDREGGLVGLILTTNWLTSIDFADLGDNDD